MLRPGWHYLTDDDGSDPLPSAVCLDVAGANAAHRSPLRLVRLFFRGRLDPDEAARRARNWHAQGYSVQLGNEPNHPIEAWPDPAPASYAAYYAQVRALCPDVDLGWAPPSPGFPNWERWYDGAEIASLLIVHAYGTFDEMTAVVMYVVERFPDKRIWVAECNFGPATGKVVDVHRWAREHLRPFLDWCSRFPQIVAVNYFAPRAPHPDWPQGTPVDALGTEVETVLRNWQPPRKESPRMLKGLALWVWYWDDRYLDVARRVGASTLLIKAADGATAWDQWEPAAAKCRAAGIEPIPWAYNYGDVREVAALAQAATRAGVHRLIVDPEVEYERLPEAGQRAFVDALRAAKQQHGLSIGCACWARPEAHGGYRFDLLAEVVDCWLPMVAWQAWSPRSAEHWLRHWDSFGHQPTAPWLPAYDGVTPDELAGSVKLALDRYGAATVWAAHVLDDAHVAALEALRPASAPSEPPPAAIDRAAALDALNGIAHHLAEANAALETARTAQERVWAEVVELKRAIGLE